MIIDNDQTENFQQIISQALISASPLQIEGGGSKSFYGRLPKGKKLHTSQHQGIINYHPSELVITARTGTLLSDIKATLAEQGQMLAFDPPSFSEKSTLGGAVACGLSGSRRPFTGSARDFILGCKIIDGHAEVLSFGGEVMKNVAGYDVSRLMVAAMGTLGLLLEVSLKVLPKPAIEQTRVFELKTEDALAEMMALSRKSLPLSALSFDGQCLYIRLSGIEKAVEVAGNKIGGEILPATDEFWLACEQQQHDFFKGDTDLWRISIPDASATLALSGDCFYEWGGALRWVKTTASSQSVFSLAEQLNGHACLFKTNDQTADIFQPMPDVLRKLNRNIKTAFDPQGVFNPNRLYREW